ncbi:MAG TPA: PIN domain nuclease [Candidatus Dormibacteraeota bacterium]|nr:PIN domain nuclease [Candidatus Dormibacteraeota bacterium]
MAIDAVYLADKSALSRLPHPAVAMRLGPLLEDGLVATCAIVDLEILYSARGLSEYEAVVAERRALDRLTLNEMTMDRAIEVQHELARVGQHRVAIPDLIIAAAAESAGLTVLHYDADFERIARRTGQRQEWVVPRGSI